MIHTKLIKHLICDTLDINWSKLILKWGNSEIFFAQCDNSTP